jgi:hypothetical protein
VRRVTGGVLNVISWIFGLLTLAGILYTTFASCMAGEESPHPSLLVIVLLGLPAAGAQWLSRSLLAHE